MNKLFILLALSLLALVTSADHTGNWAVLVAGSKGYNNYRHQSDVLHAYHILLNKGIPSDRIIVMIYDDIADNSRNPFKGKIFNKPDGDDVYAGVPLDYTGDDVTAFNFLRVIAGDAESMTDIGTGRVVESTSSDNVFIYFSDHGADNLVSFPNDYLYADDLISTLQEMYENKKYNKLVFYMEACHSGSMFEDKLLAEWNIYATTAADPSESSYAYYCGSEATVSGTKIGSCLGDEYSVKWMEQTEALTDLRTVTLKQQFELVKQQTTGSHVMQYGTTDFENDTLQDFQGKCYDFPYATGLLPRKKGKSKALEITAYSKKFKRVKNEDMKLYYLKEIADTSNDEDAYEAYLEEVRMAARSKIIFDMFIEKFSLPDPRERPSNVVDYQCLRRVVEGYKDFCGLDVDRDTKYIKYITTYCTMDLPAVDAVDAFEEFCS